MSTNVTSMHTSNLGYSAKYVPVVMVGQMIWDPKSKCQYAFYKSIFGLNAQTEIL